MKKWKKILQILFIIKLNKNKILKLIKNNYNTYRIKLINNNQILMI